MSSLEDRVARLTERADRPSAPAWTPDVAKAGHPLAIAGEIVEIGWRQNVGYENRQTVALVTIRTPAGEEWCLWCWGKILDQELARAPVGAVVAVKYEGKKEGKSNTYNLWRVVIEQGEMSHGSAPLSPIAAVVIDEVEPIATEPARAPDPPHGVGECEACGFANGKHAAGCPSKPAPERCGECGFLGGHHAEGCSSDIPF